MSDGDGVAGPAPILVVERDLEIGAPIVEQLAADGYAARLARTAEHARSLVRASPPRLLILGEIDPPRGALDLLVEVRAGRRPGDAARSSWSPSLPAIVLAADAQEPDLLRAFEAGADDFLTRSTSYLELRARLRALLARTSPRPGSTVVRVGALTIDTSTRAVHLGGREVALRRLEYELLLTLARDPARVFAKHELMRLVWGRRSLGSTRTLDSHASRLRHRLGTAGAERWVVNVRGIGYRLT